MEICACCEKQLEGILDFPSALIVAFERAELPKVIVSRVSDPYVEYNPDSQTNLKDLLPEDKLKQLLESSGEQVFHEHHVFFKHPDKEGTYIHALNETESVHDFLALEQVRTYLARIENSVGREVPREQMVPPKVPNSDLRLRLIEREERGDKRVCGINLFGNYHGHWSGAFAVPMVDMDIATLTYEGRLNQ